MAEDTNRNKGKEWSQESERENQGGAQHQKEQGSEGDSEDEEPREEQKA